MPSCRLDGCKLNQMSCETVKRSLQSAIYLTQLDLSCNALGDSGVQILSAGLTSPHCKLQTLRFVDFIILTSCCVSEPYSCMKPFRHPSEAA